MEVTEAERAQLRKLLTTPAKRSVADTSKPLRNGEEELSASGFIEIAKASPERQTVTGIVLQPDEVDGHGDIMSADVILDAAHKYLSKYNQKTKLGLQHNNFKRQFELVESWIAPMDLTIGSKFVKAGSWVMTVKVLSAKIWQAIKDGKVTGFSIGGKAKVRSLGK